MRQTISNGRKQSMWISRLTTLSVVSLSLGSYFWQPVFLIHYAFDILLRTYLHFVAGAMAHEAAHGHMGNSKASNLWWGRVALIPTTVPSITFRKTHIQHHAHTNIPGKDPDEFLNTKRLWQIPFRALAMPHHWLLWLWKQKRFTRADAVEYLLTYAFYAIVYGTIAHFTGVQRVLLGLLPAAVLHSWMLWYFFAIKTHEGYSTMAAETRSHNYYGAPLYWVTFGLSMHRLHHLKPQLAWLQMSGQVRQGTLSQRLLLRREIVQTAS